MRAPKRHFRCGQQPSVRQVSGRRPSAVEAVPRLVVAREIGLARSGSEQEQAAHRLGGQFDQQPAVDVPSVKRGAAMGEGEVGRGVADDLD
jgi:hypothetical protein